VTIYGISIIDILDTSIGIYHRSIGNSKIDGKCLDTIEGAVVMIRSTLEEFGSGRNRRFRWEAFLPKRNAWIQTLILLPFGLSVANFLGGSWQFSVRAIVDDRQYVIGVLSMAINLLLPSLFFACLLHWGWFVWKQAAPTWFPTAQAFWAGAYATLTIAASFGIVGLFTHSLGICGNPAWGDISQNLLCNLDGYGFESRSWFGAWFIVAAYCYQAQASISSLPQRIFRRHDRSAQIDRPDFTAVATAHGDLDSIEIVAPNGEE
jgi:hypothetical protein